MVEKRRESDLHKSRARILYDFEMECREQGWGDPAFVYEEDKDLLRWTAGGYAFFHEHADWELLRKRGRIKGTTSHVVSVPDLSEAGHTNPRSPSCGGRR